MQKYEIWRLFYTKDQRILIKLLSICEIWKDWKPCRLQVMPHQTTLSLSARCGANLGIKMQGAPQYVHGMHLQRSPYFQTWTVKISTAAFLLNCRIWSTNVSAACSTLSAALCRFALISVLQAAAEVAVLAAEGVVAPVQTAAVGSAVTVSTVSVLAIVSSSVLTVWQNTGQLSTGDTFQWYSGG